MFIVPDDVVLVGACEDGVVAESTTSRVSTTVSISAASTTRRSSACWAPTFTYSVRSSSTVRLLVVDADHGLDLGERLERLGEPAAPVGREAGDQDAPASPSAQPNQTDLRSASMSQQVLLDPRADLVGDRLHERLVLVHPLLLEVDGLEEAELELGRQVAEHPEQPEVRERRA